MSNSYYDVPITLDVVIAINAKTRQEANEKIDSMTEEDLIYLLSEQVSFLGTTATVQ